MDELNTENTITLSRMASTTIWYGNRLVVTTSYSFQNPKDGNWLTSEVTQTVWLQPAKGTPWEPSMAVETKWGSALNGPATTNRTVYTRGYR